jgi:hypothetical protein
MKMKERYVQKKTGLALDRVQWQALVLAVLNIHQTAS